MSSTGANWPDALIGKVLQDTYRIERSIGSGGMGSVYEASHLRLRKRLAVKVLSPAVANSAEALARFRQEALVTSALGNPNIVEVFDFNHMEDGTPYIVMELLQGEDLAMRLQREGRLALPRMVNIFRQAAAALHAAHQKGIIHRDLKPQNVFLCQREEQDDYVKIVDFGISKVLGSRHAMTGTHELLGSPTYMSPEQALVKASKVDLRADVFTMGTLAYLMLTGTPPFSADTMPDLLYKIVREDPPSLCGLLPELPAAVEQVIFRALSKNRKDRFGSMEEFSQQLCGAAAQQAPALAAVALTGRAAIPAPPTGDTLMLEDQTVMDQMAAGSSGSSDDETLVELEVPDVVELDEATEVSGVTGDIYQQPTLRQGSSNLHLQQTLIRPRVTGPQLSPEASEASEQWPPEAVEDLGSTWPDAPAPGSPTDDADDLPQPAQQTPMQSAPGLEMETTAMVSADTPLSSSASESPEPRRGRSAVLWIVLAVLAVGAGLAVAVVVYHRYMDLPWSSRQAAWEKIKPLSNESRSDSDAPTEDAKKSPSSADAAETTTPGHSESAPAKVAPAKSAPTPNAPTRPPRSTPPPGHRPVTGRPPPRRPLSRTTPGPGSRVRPRTGRRPAPTITRTTLRVIALSAGQPVPAEIYLDGRKVGQSPLFLRDVTTGMHRVEARLAGHEPVTRRRKLAADRSNKVILNLQK